MIRLARCFNQGSHRRALDQITVNQVQAEKRERILQGALIGY